MKTLLLKRFQEEFNTVWSEVTDTDEVNYTKVSELLKGLKFIDNQTAAGGFHAERELVRSIWPMMKLEDESNLSKRNLETFLCAVMNFPQEEKKPVKEANEEVTEKDVESTPKPGYGRVENSLFLLNPGDTLRIHKHYKALYDHRATATSKSNLNPTFKSIVEYSYQPALSKGSQRLTEAHLGNITGKGYQHHYDYLADEGRIKAERLQELAKKTEAEVSKECVFQPATDKKSNKMLAQVEVKETEGLASDYFRLLVTEDGQPREKTAVLYDLATFADQRRRKLAKTKAEREMEKNAAECIFEPETAVPLGTIQADLEVRALPARGVDKTVERLIKARKDFEALQALKARGMTNKATREVEKSESTEPMTVLTAVVSGRMQEFRIRAGEHFGTLMSAFAAQHRLGSEELPVIESQLREQYRSLLGKDPE